MRNKWLRLGCFLTGYNFQILRGCSELSLKRVIRYTAAMVIICILWAFIGFTFTDRYLKAEWYSSIVGAVIMVILVVQIERQVILSTKENKAPLYFRAVIAATMAIIGSVIIDQIIFKEDIEQQKVFMMDAKVKRVLPARAEEYKRQIKEIDSVILYKEGERRELVMDISKHPTVPVYTRQVTSQHVDSIRRDVVTKTSSQIQNPKIALLQPLDIQIAGLRIQKIKKDSLLLGLRPRVEEELAQRVGFLDELQLMFSILFESGIALGVWILWFVFFLGIEAFILVSKWNEPETDYDAVIKQQMQLHYDRLALLRKVNGDVKGD